MNERKELTRPNSEVSCQHPEFISPSSHGEHQGNENPSDPEPSALGRLSKFFGWWIVIAGVSYV